MISVFWVGLANSTVSVPEPDTLHGTSICLVLLWYKLVLFVCCIWWKLTLFTIITQP